MLQYRQLTADLWVKVNGLKFWMLVDCQKGLDKNNLWIPALITFILFENRKRKVFNVLEQLS